MVAEVDRGSLPAAQAHQLRGQTPDERRRTGRHWAAGLVIALGLTAPAWLPWMDPALFLWSLDDAENHLLRLYVFGWAIEHGVWYPRWAPDLFMGYGFPVLNFYSPGFYYLGLFLKSVFRLSVWEAFRAPGLVAALLAVAGAYALGTALWGRRSAGVVAAATLLYAPYAFAINLYKRGDIPEALGIAILPWLLLSLWHLWTAKTSHGRLAWMTATTVAGAAEILTHNLSALLAAAVAGVWVLALYVGRPSLVALRSVVVAGALALGVSAFFWLPALGEARAVHLESLRQGDHDYALWLVDPSGRAPRERREDNRQTRTGLIDTNVWYPHQLLAGPKLSLGLATLGGAALLTAGAIAVKRRARKSLALMAVAVVGLLNLHWQLGGSSFRLLQPTPGAVGFGVLAGCVLAMVVHRRRPNPLFPLLTVAIVCWYLTFTVSAPVWERVPGLSLLQFPWRLMGPLAVCLAVATAGATATAAGALERRWGQPGRRLGWALTALVLAGVAFNSLGARPLDRAPPYPARQIDGQAMADNEASKIGRGSTTSREFTPRDVRIADLPGVAGFDRGLWERLYPEAEWAGRLLYPLHGDLRLLGWRADQLAIRVRVANDAPQIGVLGVRQFRFPGWRAWVDGSPVPVGTAPDVPEQQASLGFITLQVPPGEHDLVLRFGPTRLRLVAIGVTVATVVAVGVALIQRARRTRFAPLWLVATAASLLVAATAYGAWREIRAIAPSDVAPLTLPAVTTGDVWHTPGPDDSRSRLLLNLSEALSTAPAPITAPTGGTIGRAGTSEVIGRGQLTVTNGQDREIGIAGVSRREWLYASVPSSVSVDVALPPMNEGWFQALLAVDPVAWLDASGAQFRVQVTSLVTASDPGPVTLLERTLDPLQRPADRRWVPVVADLSPWAGQTVRLTLHTTPGMRQGGGAVRAGWGTPMIVTGETPRAPLRAPG
ncbi:MAG: 6-pyruvoyl-tetrahydropterin synthase-related protein [Chloroflexota bacterium]|nr:6-pyruvoyl-tetrahydropterin synthase-related protein [Chloroflexota bacterium]